MMSPKFILRSLVLLLAAFCLFSLRLAAQDDAPSVADAARRARQQKQDAAKPAHVIDNDVIPPSPSASGSNASSDSNAAGPAGNTSASPAAAKPEANPADEAKKKEETEALKKEIADKKEKINFQQREIALAQDSYYSNPDHEHDTSGKDKLNSMQADLTHAQSELADLQAKLAAAEPPADEKPAEPAKPQP
jgi:hypothetical protein